MRQDEPRENVDFIEEFEVVKNKSLLFARLSGPNRIKYSEAKIMKSQLFLAHIGLLHHGSDVWGFTALVLLILFIALVATTGSKDKGK